MKKDNKYLFMRFLIKCVELSVWIKSKWTIDTDWSMNVWKVSKCVEKRMKFSLILIAWWKHLNNLNFGFESTIIIELKINVVLLFLQYSSLQIWSYQIVNILLQWLCFKFFKSNCINNYNSKIKRLSCLWGVRPSELLFDRLWNA